MKTRAAVIPAFALPVAVVVLVGCGGGRQSPSSSDPASPYQSSTSLIVAPSSASVYQGGTVQFQAQVLGQSNQVVTWSLQDNFGTIDTTGLYTAPKDRYGGPEIVTATSQADPHAKGTAAVTVLSIEVKVFP